MKNLGWRNKDSCIKCYEELSTEKKFIVELDNCPICYEKIDNSINYLPCGHSFHKSCLENYINNNLDKDYILCPYCIKNILYIH